MPELIEHEPQAMTAPSAGPLAAFNAESLIAKAIETQTPIETMERLLMMRKELKAEAAEEAYYDALSRFQASVPPILKRSQAGEGRFSYRYADLGAIQQAISPALQANGLSFTFNTETLETGFTVVCTVHHRDGHSEPTRFDVPIDKAAKMNDTQKAGSALTYGRRYALTAALGIVTADADDDAQSLNNPPAATTPAPSRPTPPPAQRSAKRGLTEKQLKLLGARIKEAGASREAVKEWCKVQFKVESSQDLNGEQLDSLLKALPVIAFHQQTPPPEQPRPAELTRLVTLLGGHGWKPGAGVDALEDAVKRIRHAANSARSMADHTDGPDYHREIQRANELAAQATAIEARATQLLELQP